MATSSEVVMGHQKKLEINGTEVCVVNLDLTDTVESKDVSQSGTNGQYRRRAGGMAGVTITATINLSLGADNPFSDPPAIVPGTYLTDVKYYPDRGDTAQFWHLPSAYIPDDGVSASMEDPTILSVTIESDDIFYRPVG